MDYQVFFKHLRRSGLLPEGQIRQVEARLPASQPAAAVARTLVDEGLLTRYQAEQLLGGKALGFILGQYRILEGLSKGGMGCVFKAVHTLMHRVVALKVIVPQNLRDPQACELFKREVRVAAQLQHPNILAALDAGEVNGIYYLVTEYVEGPTLEQLIQREVALPPRLACELIRQAAVGLQYAHEKGMVHRDIKPANVLISHWPGWKGAAASRSGPSVKILDFGLARLRDANQPIHKIEDTIAVEAGAVLGTADYMSPEQACDVHAVDIRSDLYSLGCTLYFTLTGRVPFPARSPVQKIFMHSLRMPTPADQVRLEVPVEVAALAQRLMAKDPADRFQTPEELVNALKPWCRRETKQTVSTTVHVGPRVRTHSGNDAEQGGGWVLEELDAEVQSAPSDMRRTQVASPPVLVRPMIRSVTVARNGVVERKPASRRRSRLWLAVGFASGALLASALSAFLLM